MVTGVIWKQLLLFFFPIMLGSLFQQLYNTVDAIVVGKFVGTDALAAVGGSASNILNLLIGFFTGVSSGATVIISQYFGANDRDGVNRALHTAMLFALVGGAFIMVLGLIGTEFMLRLMDTPEDTIAGSALYLRIMFMGMVPNMVYNVGSAILRAMGDSKRPLYFLIVACLSNVVLDLVFVLVFKMGVAGVAWATVISQFLSAALVIITLMRSDNCCRMTLKALRINKIMLGKILKIGIPAAIQMAVTSFSNVFVQSYINHFGADCMGGWTAYSKIDQFLLLPMQSIALASTTFVGQNLGVNDVARAKKGVRTAILIAVGSTVVLMIPVLIFAEPLVAFFNSKPEVVSYGSMLLRLISPFYVFCCINQILAGSLRGAGDSRSAMFIMLGCFVLFRQIYLYVMTNYITNTIVAVALGYPAGWMLCSLITYVYFRFSNWEKYRIVD